MAVPYRAPLIKEAEAERTPDRLNYHKKFSAGTHPLVCPLREGVSLMFSPALPQNTLCGKKQILSVDGI
jgi:hypothetical protein